MKIISALISIAIGLGAIAVANVSLTEYFGGAEKKVENLTALKNIGEKTIAVMNETYLEVGETGTIGYKFKVDEKEYEGTFSFSDPEEVMPIVTYLPSDPSINSLDVEKELEKETKSSNSSIGLWAGIGLILFALFQFYKGYAKLTYKPEPAA